MFDNIVTRILYGLYCEPCMSHPVYSKFQICQSVHFLPRTVLLKLNIFLAWHNEGVVIALPGVSVRAASDGVKETTPIWLNWEGNEIHKNTDLKAKPISFTLQKNVIDYIYCCLKIIQSDYFIFRYEKELVGSWKSNRYSSAITLNYQNDSVYSAGLKTGLLRGPLLN